MATNYSSNLSTTNQYILYRIVAEDVNVDYAGNKSGLRVRVQVWRTNTGYTTYGHGTCTVEINGEEYTSDITANHKFTHNSYTTIFDKTVEDIAHWSNGTMSIPITAKIDHSRFDSSGTGRMTKALTETYGASYVVSFDANGGTGAPDAQTKYYTKRLTLPATEPTRDGYTFMGWSIEKDASAEYSACGAFDKNGNTTLYAVWKKAIVLTYDANGGSGAPSKVTAEYYNSEEFVAIEVSTVEPTRNGYTFLGWSMESDIETAEYVGGDEILLIESNTLYAVWSVVQIALTVNPNGGSWDGSTGNTVVKQTYGTTAEIPNPTWKGHTFCGWSLEGGGSLSGTTYTFGTNGGILTANWDANEFPVIFDAGTNGGTVNGKEIYSVNVEYGNFASIPMAERNGCVFKGWFTAPTGGDLVTTLTVTRATTLYAQFDIDASVYVNVGGVWKGGMAFVNGKKGYAKVNDDGTWKNGFC